MGQGGVVRVVRFARRGARLKRLGKWLDFKQLLPMGVVKSHLPQPTTNDLKEPFVKGQPALKLRKL